MAFVARVGDVVICGKGRIGIWISGSSNVITEGSFTVRTGLDIYACPHCIGFGIGGAFRTLTNGLPTHRFLDRTIDCDGSGITIGGATRTLAIS